MYTDIRIDGESLDLGEAPKLPVNLVNPHLTYEQIPNSVANIPNIPFSVRNQRIFEYAEMPQAGNDLYSYLCEVINNGAIVYKGNAYVKESDPQTGYALDATDDLGRFFGLFSDLPLTELDLGTVELPPVLTADLMMAGKKAVCFPSILNPDYYGTNGPALDPPFTGIVNEYTGTAYAAAGPKVPMLFVSFLLDRIAQLTGVTLSGSFLTHPVWQTLILTNWRALDGDQVVTVNRHVPAWTIGQFIIELRKIPNLRYKFDTPNKRLQLDFWEPQMDLTPVKDWTAKATPGHKKIPEFNRRLQLAFELDGGDSLMKDKPEIMGDYFTPATGNLGGDAIGLVKVPIRLSTFLVDETTGLPVAKQTGVTKEFNQLAVTTAPRLLFWHGITENQPLASPELAGIRLYLTGPGGIAATSWKRTERLRREMFYLRKSFTLSEIDLATLDFSQPIHYKGLNYLVAHVAGDLPIEKEFACLLVKI
ncbi:hypothetical protein [Dyadobacter crusticola]|uniref:hypothetical protein n=1 Tax=Dyadobacter crusticola TaxID=292407 RepID=UPI0004E124A0|nr:hypothetical protein [Dyadobacter crusticola]